MKREQFGSCNTYLYSKYWCRGPGLHRSRRLFLSPRRGMMPVDEGGRLSPNIRKVLDGTFPICGLTRVGQLGRFQIEMHRQLWNPSNS